MVRVLVIGFLLLIAPALRANSLSSARLARALLGPGVWSRVLRIENASSDPTHPRQFHALVFAFEGELWFYDSDEGTQSLSLYAGRLEQDQASLAPLLRTILPGLVAFQEVDDGVDSNPAPALARNDAPLPFGCLVKCFARWRTLQSSPTAPDDAKILAFYFAPGTNQHGHSVLVYRERGRRYFYDPDDGKRRRLWPRFASLTPLQMANEICRIGTPTKARVLALHETEASIGRLVAANAYNSTVTNTAASATARPSSG